MDILAYYIMVNDEEVDDMMDLDDAGLIAYIDDLEKDKSERFCLDRMWDGMHFLISGKSLEDAEDDDENSATVVGVHAFDTSDEIFVGCTESGELEDIIEIMGSVGIDALCSKADLSKFRKNDIYPDIWFDESKDKLMIELKNGFTKLLEFYKAALKKNLNVIISIY